MKPRGDAGSRVGYFLKCDRVVEGEVSRRRSAQRSEVRGRAERLAEIARQCPDVGALGHRDLDVPRDLRLDLHTKKPSGGHVDVSRLEVECLSGTRFAVRDLPVDLDRRERRRNLFVLPHQRCDHRRRGEGVGGLLGHGGHAHGAPLGVVGVGLRAEHDPSQVGLFGRGEVGGEPCRRADQYDEQSGGHGIEGARVSDTLLAEGTADAIHHVVAGKPFGLVDDEDA